MQALMSNVLILRPRVTLLAVVVSSLASVLLASKSFAADVNPSKNTSTAVVTATPPKKIFGLDASLSYASNMYADGEYDRTSSTSLSFIPSAKITDRATLSIRTNFIKDHEGAKNFYMSNTTLRLSHKTAEINPTLTWRNRIDGIAPTNRDSQLTDRLQGAVGVGTSLTYANKNTTLPFTIVGLLSAQRNFHEYDMNADGAKNNQYGITQGLSLDLSFTDSLTLSIAGNYRTAMNYDNKPKYSYDTSIDLDYGLTDNFSISTGISNGGSALKANGIDSNISFTDKKTAELNVAMNFSY
ncbi:hypothetical protein [Pseudobdellovibrio sp. HCB154]|uniref:hypothetical protein n=1 Tax=Pseudobdellovibrio sp. HCB154 TaxID=3386277 RepID=UPI0039175FB9